MLAVGDKHYFIDLNAIDKVITIDDGKEYIVEKTTKSVAVGTNDTVVTETTKTPLNKEVDMAKYDLIQMMLGIVLGTEDEMDETLGADRGLAKMPLNYKIAFNTLLKNKILVEL